jgi:hypothetical protein
MPCFVMRAICGSAVQHTPQPGDGHAQAGQPALCRAGTEAAGLGVQTVTVLQLRAARYPPLGAAVDLKLIEDAGMLIRTFCAPMNQLKQRTAFLCMGSAYLARGWAATAPGIPARPARILATFAEGLPRASS